MHKSSEIIDSNFRVSISIQKRPSSKQKHELSQAYKLTLWLTDKTSILKIISVRFGYHIKIV
jgi:hypothetical protein